MLRLSAQQSLPPLVDLGSKSVPGLGKVPLPGRLGGYFFVLDFLWTMGWEMPPYLNMADGRPFTLSKGNSSISCIQVNLFSSPKGNEDT